MTIRPGAEWGVLEQAPPDTLWFRDEASLASFVEREGFNLSVGLSDGELHAAAGRPTDTIKASIDIVEVVVEWRANKNPGLHLCLSSLVLGSWWRQRPLTLLANSGSIEGIEWFPRSHPNDGRFEIAEIAQGMGIRQRVLARQRARRGESTSHPLITQSTTDSWEWTGPPRRLVIDRRGLGSVTHVRATLQTDALTVFLGNPSTRD
jgi:hypothetical protein